METSLTEIRPWTLFLMGGPMMWPILICSLSVVMVIIQKAVSFYSVLKDMAGLKGVVFAEVENNNIKGALSACEKSGSSFARVLRSGLIMFGLSRAEISAKMEDAAKEEVFLLEQGLPVLGGITHMAPLLGFVGTVIGLIGIFHIVQVRSLAMNPVTPADISGGIWQALIATASGLIVGVVAMAAYYYFMDHLNKVVREMERVSVSLVDIMTRDGRGSLDKE